LTVNSKQSENFLPVTFVFHPEWWYKNYGLSFEREFFYDPDTRVEADLRMRKILNERFGKYNIEKEAYIESRPCIGAVHLAAGYIISEMFGCEVKYTRDSSPQVISKNISDEEADKIGSVNFNKNETFQELKKLIEQLKKKFGYVMGDVNWQGVLNVALDIRGDEIFIDMLKNPKRAGRIFNAITETIKNFVNYVKSETGTSSISVNRAVKFVNPEINLHSNCSVAMISANTYRDILLEYDIKLAKALQSYGIHHCGNNMHIYADSYAQVPGVSFFDVGWGSDISLCRQKLPEAFLNLRYDPVKIRKVEPGEVKEDVNRMLEQSGNPEKTGICCINMGWDVPEKNILTVIETVEEYRKRFVYR